MLKRTVSSGNTPRGLAALAILLSLTTLSKGQASEPFLSGYSNEARQKLPPGVPQGYVITPFGYFHPSCVKEIEEGETLLADGRIIHKGGTVDISAPICSFPHFSPGGLLVTDQLQEREPGIGTTNSGWIEYISTTATTGTSYSQLSA